jgi:hypothetical protein
MVMVETSVRSGFMEATHTPDEGESPDGSPSARLEAGAHQTGEYRSWSEARRAPEVGD